MQIDALETLVAHVHPYLISPRLIAALLVFPIQTAFFCLIGLVGGYLSGSVVLALQPGVYWSAVFHAVHPVDVRESMIKASVFGVLTIAICAYNGFNAHRRSTSSGARAVSASTTRAVVISSIIVLAADYVITSFLV